MSVGLLQLVAPAQEPVSLSEAKLWVKEDLDDNDTLLAGLVRSARSFVENVTATQLLTATWQYTLDCFPGYGLTPWLARPQRLLWNMPERLHWLQASTIRLPKPPLQSVTSITYVDSVTSNTLTLDPTLYQVEQGGVPARVSPSYGNVWPYARYQNGAVKVTFVSGYGDQPDAVPPELLTVVRFLVANWYENREASSPQRMAAVEFAARDMLNLGWYGEYV